MRPDIRKTILIVTLMSACARGGAVEPPTPEPEPEPPVTTPAPAPDDPPPTPRPAPEPPPRDPPPPDPEPTPEPEPAPLPPGVLAGSILPRERIVAFYGNPRSERMGILGELPRDQMLERLDQEVAAWRRADPDTPVRPALHMIAVMATGDPGPDSLYRLRMPRRVIDEVISWAESRGAIVFLDIQPGRSTVAAELPFLMPWLERPNVHLALDPEWKMAADEVPGRSIGSMRAAEVNHAVDALARLVEAEGLPPKVLVVHRFTRHMLPDAGQVKNDPRVQVVLNMDGWGPPAQKVTTYRAHVADAAIPYKGFKLFYKNDRRGGSRMMTPAEVLALVPAPIYIQYQ